MKRGTIKNWMAALLCVFLITGILSGCRNSAEKPSNDDSTALLATEETEGTDSKNDSEETGLDYVELVWHGSQMVSKDNEKVHEKINEYLREKLNCTFKFVTGDDSNIDQKFSVILASGEQSDIMWTSNHRNDTFANISKGAFLPLNDLLKQYAPTMYEAIPEYVWNSVTVNGSIYAVPGYLPYTMQPTLLLNKDIVDSVGYDMSQVDTIMDLEPLFDKILEKYPDKICVDASQGWLVSYATAGVFDRIEKYSTVGINVDDPNAKVTTQYLSEFGQEIFKLAERWYEAGYFDPNVNAVQDSSGDRKNQKVVGWFQHIAYDGYGSDLVKGNMGFEMYEVPCTNEPPLVATTTVCGSMHAIPISSKNPERAMMVMELIFTDRYLQDLFAYGIEGEHFNYTDDGKVVKTESGMNGYKELAAVKNIKVQSVLDNYPDNYVELVEAYNDSARPSPLIGFTYDSADTSPLLVSVKSVWDEYFVTLACGMVDYDTVYPQFAAKMEQAGIDELIADVQRQVDEFLKTKR